MSVTESRPVLADKPPSLLGKVLRLPLRVIPRTTRVPILSGPLRGKRWIMGSNVHRCWLGSYEYSLQKAFVATIKRGDIVYDLGATVGFYSLLASVLAGPEGHVFSVEPVPENLTYLRTHLEMNGVKNCTVLEGAISLSEGMSQFDRGFDPHRRIGRLDKDAENGLTVRTYSLDHLVAAGQLKPPNVIKCDIEGAEYEALKGASNTLSKYRPAIFLSTHGADVHENCCALLKDLRYELTALDDLPLSDSREIAAIPRGAGKS